MRRDYHLILGIEPGANKKSIQKAFHRLAREFHPDVSSAPDAEERFKEINEAYQYLMAFAVDGPASPELERRKASARASATLDYVAAYMHGYNLYQRRMFGLAVEEFSRALRLNPEYGSAYEYRGRCYRQLGEFQRALSDLDRAITLDAEDAFVIRERADVRFALHDYQGAIADATTALKIYPGLASAHNVRGNAYSELKDFGQAIQDYSSAIGLDPEHGPYYYNRAWAFSALRQYDASFADYTQALALDPAYVDAYLNRANDYGFMERYDEALADLTAAIGLAPDNHKLYNSRGQIFMRVERYDEALADFQQILELESEYALAYLNQGVVHLIREEYDLALDAFDRGETLLASRQYNMARSPAAPTLSLIRALAYHGKGEDALAQRIWLRDLLPLDPRYRDPRWVIHEHLILPPLRGRLETLVRSLPENPPG